tara:strand:+ start:581 stop:889 length:309 start_codon:yes stop_codon:yes gene_type:complete
MTWDRTLTTNTHTIYLASHHPRNATLPVQFIITDGKHGYNFGSYNRDSGEGKMTIKNIGMAKLFTVEKELEVYGEVKIDYKILLGELMILLRINRERKECWQ